jgi:hypothetical protein
VRRSDITKLLMQDVVRLRYVTNCVQLDRRSKCTAKCTPQALKLQYGAFLVFKGVRVKWHVCKL